MNKHVRAFVVGATGYTGQAVVARLRALGVETYAHIRPDSPRLARRQSAFEALGAEVDVTPWAQDSMNARLAELRPTLVFGLLGVTRSGAKREARARGTARATYESVDVALTLMAARAAAAVEPAPRFVYLSSLGAGPNTASAYLKARWTAEQAIEALGLPFTVARPCFITGADREGRAVEKVGGMAANALVGALGALGAGRTARRYRSRTSQDLAAALVRLALDPDAEGRVFDSEEF